MDRLPLSCTWRSSSTVSSNVVLGRTLLTVPVICICAEYIVPGRFDPTLILTHRFDLSEMDKCVWWQCEVRRLTDTPHSALLDCTTPLIRSSLTAKRASASSRLLFRRNSLQIPPWVCRRSRRCRRQSSTAHNVSAVPLPLCSHPCSVSVSAEVLLEFLRASRFRQMTVVRSA